MTNSAAATIYSAGAMTDSAAATIYSVGAMTDSTGTTPNSAGVVTNSTNTEQPPQSHPELDSGSKPNADKEPAPYA